MYSTIARNTANHIDDKLWSAEMLATSLDNADSPLLNGGSGPNWSKLSDASLLPAISTPSGVLEPLIVNSDSSSSSSSSSSSNMSWRFPRELDKLLWSFLFMFFVSFCECFASVVVHIRLPDPANHPPLPDIVLENLPFFPVAFKLAEATTILLLLVLAVVCFFHKHRFIILRRLFVLLGSIYILRIPTMTMTSLSAPSEHLHCKSQDYISLWSVVKRSFVILLGSGMSLNGIKNCGDYVFSGHTVVLTLLNYFILEYTPPTLRMLRVCCWIANITAMLAILSAREHYSVDVFLAFFVASILFAYYHCLANIQSGSVQRPRAWFWIPLFCYFESSVDGAVPNEFDSPASILTNIRRQFVSVLSSVRRQCHSVIDKV